MKTGQRDFASDRSSGTGRRPGGLKGQSSRVCWRGGEFSARHGSLVKQRQLKRSMDDERRAANSLISE